MATYGWQQLTQHVQHVGASTWAKVDASMRTGGKSARYVYVNTVHYQGDDKPGRGDAVYTCTVIDGTGQLRAHASATSRSGAFDRVQDQLYERGLVTNPGTSARGEAS